MTIQDKLAVGPPAGVKPRVGIQGSVPAAHTLRDAAGPAATAQYTVVQMLGIWASVALPMGVIYWVVVPILMPRVDVNPGFLYVNLIALGMLWQAAVAYVILRREVKPFTWENIKDRCGYTPRATPGRVSRPKGCTSGRFH